MLNLKIINFVNNFIKYISCSWHYFNKTFVLLLVSLKISKPDKNPFKKLEEINKNKIIYTVLY